MVGGMGERKKWWGEGWVRGRSGGGRDAERDG